MTRNLESAISDFKSPGSTNLSLPFLQHSLPYHGLQCLDDRGQRECHPLCSTSSLAPLTTLLVYWSSQILSAELSSLWAPDTFESKGNCRALMMVPLTKYRVPKVLSWASQFLQDLEDLKFQQVRQRDPWTGKRLPGTQHTRTLIHMHVHTHTQTNHHLVVFVICNLKKSRMKEVLLYPTTRRGEDRRFSQIHGWASEVERKRQCIQLILITKWVKWI